MLEHCVSIITPTYNSEKYITDTISAVQCQSYQNWEMIIVDDCSSDHTLEIVSAIALYEPRIKVLRQKTNMGAGPARTRALVEATGRFVAYLDADDIWYPEKLKEQVAFMLNNDIAFSCCSYEVIDGNGNSLNIIVHQLPEVDYKGFLTNNLLQTVGIMADISKIDKTYLHMPSLRRRQDAATWMQVLKAGFKCYGMQKVLAKYRHTNGSLSGNKLIAAKDTWYLYRKVEHLSLQLSLYCFARYVRLAIKKRVYVKHHFFHIL